MKKVSRRELAHGITAELLAGKDPATLMRQTAAYLIDHKMIHQADMLIDDIAIELEQATGHMPATVRAAFALSEATREQLRQYIMQATGATSVELSVVQDDSLLAGVVIRTPQHEYDASARHKLTQLARGDI